ncbi:hypothetical protein [Ilumatobacter sp.]|uniref:hypothetical protein n=1 Tax=Ilumatobacter sp. TaxID=1967498 RepID=UPI003B51DF2E
MQNDKGVRDLAKILAPDATIVSTSSPEPALKSLNVVAIFDDDEASRSAVLALEGVENDDASIGLVSLASKSAGAADERPEARAAGVQPEDTDIASDTLGRTAKGGIIGAVVGAAIFALVGFLLAEGGVIIGAAVGGALFGAFIGGVWGAFARFGGSDAYRESFARNEGGITLVSLHTDDADEARRAEELLADGSLSAPMVFRRDGDRVWSENTPT